LAKKKATSSLGLEEKKALIEHADSTLTIKHQCELLDLSRSTAYHQNVENIISQTEIDIKNAIDRIHYKEPAYGVRRIRKELAKQGFNKIGKRLLRRYMEEMGVHVFYPGPNLSKRDKQSKIYPYLLRNLEINRPNQVWSIDITFIGTPKGFVYMAAIIDWHSRFILGWSISNTLQSDFVVRTVESAISIYGKPEIINSDQGSQFTSKAYVDSIKSFDSICAR
jgi:putative transposase